MISATKRAQIRSIHPFPARMAPSIVWDSLPANTSPLTVLDPMGGSGTTLVCAREKGHYAIGCDTDPLALLIMRAWCSDIDADAVQHRGRLVLARARELAGRTPYRDAYPKNADAETRRFIRFWFDWRNRRELFALATCIARVRCRTEKDLLWCAFSRLIITKTAGASLAMDVSHSRPHKAYSRAAVRPFEKFLKSLEYVTNNSPFKACSDHIPAPEVRWGDARMLPVETESVDMIITSPPYLNAIDYLRGHKLSLVWMGHSIPKLRRLRSQNIGSEISAQDAGAPVAAQAVQAIGDIATLDRRRQGMIWRYVSDMIKVMSECRRVLKPGGIATFVVGNSAISGVFIRNSEALIRIAEAHGLNLTLTTTRSLKENKRYLPPPNHRKAGARMQTRMREEVILRFKKC